MPLFNVHCPKCGLRARRLLPNVEALKGLPCKDCGETMVREQQNPTLHNKEVLNLPHMLKPVERFTDAEKLYEERSKADPRKPE